MSDTTVNNTENSYYEDGGWEAWQILITICVVVAMAILGLLIWRAIVFSQHVDVEHEKTQQTRIQTCQHDDNVRLCIVKTEE